MTTDVTQANIRYSRQMLFAPIGPDGQRRLLQSRVAVVGMGALGTVVAEQLVRAGVGSLRLIDRDFVEWSNLQRQTLYDERDAAEGMPKAAAAARRLRLINGTVEIEPRIADLNAANAEPLLDGFDLVLDGSDNFAVRYLINDVCVKHGIPWIYGGAVASRGVTMTIVPGRTPCLRCLFGQSPEAGSAETCETAGVIGPIVHVVASWQAAEALKLLVGDEANVSRRLLHIDLWRNEFGTVDVSDARKPDCPTCGQGRFEYLDAKAQGETFQTLCGRNAVQVHPVKPLALHLPEWAAKWSKLGEVESNAFLLKLRVDGDRTIVLFPDGRAIVQGTADETAAKSLYSRYVGM